MNDDSTRPFAFTLLTIVTLAMVTARIARTEFVYEPSLYRAEGDSSPDAPPRDWPKNRPAPTPMFSSNDKSRWFTVQALVDEGSFAIGRREIQGNDAKKYRDTGLAFDNGKTMTVDLVLNPQTGHFYSSKPPLLTLLAAGEYWLLKHGLGWSMAGDANKVVKTILLTFNVLPLALYLLMMQRLLDRFCATEWAKLFLFAAACFGTFLTTFAVSLNNHTPAAVTALAAVYPFLTASGPTGRRDLRLVSSRFLSRESFATIGLPLPALPSNGSLVASGLCAGLTACLELPALAFLTALAIVVALRSPLRSLLFWIPAILVFSSEFALNKVAIGEWMPVYSKFGGPWYEYAGSHWLNPPPGTSKQGIDWARLHESRAVYIFHCLFGHHGLFSLTPVWFIAFAGMIRRTLRRNTERPGANFLYPLCLLVSLTVIGYYLIKTDNYGGWTSGLRWLFWLSPLWLLTAQPAVDRMAASAWGRRLGCAALAVSAFSASYPVWNPWRHPWIYHLLDSQGWIPY